MKLKNIIMICIIAISLFLSVALYIYQDNNNYAFKVNGEKVAISEFNTYFGIQKKLMQGASDKPIIWNELYDGVPNIEIARENAKKYVVDIKVKLSEAKKRGITLTNTEKKAIEYQILSSLKDIMEHYNLTEEEMTSLNENSYLIEKLASTIYKETDHTTHEHGVIDIEKYEAGEETTGESYDARHILFDTRGKTDEEKQTIRTKAQGVLDRVKNGEDFATLAKEFTEDTGSKANGGLYEGVSKGDFIPEFEKAALSLKPGEIYPELVEGMYGYHIIKLEGIENTLSTEEAEEIVGKEFEEISQKWVESANVELGSQYYSIGLEESKPNVQEDVSEGTNTASSEKPGILQQQKNESDSNNDVPNEG